MIGRKINVFIDDEVHRSPVVVLLKYKTHYIVRLADGSTMGVDIKEDVHSLEPNYVTDKTLQKYINANQQQIIDIKAEIDAISWLLTHTSQLKLESFKLVIKT